MANEPIQGLPYPLPSAVPDVPTDVKALADAVAGRLVMRFATTAARDAAITAPVSGMKAVIGSGAALTEYTHNGTSWVLTGEDTGWVTSGLAVNPFANFAITSYRLRRMSGVVRGEVIVTYSGATLTVSSVGTINETGMFTLPAGWGCGAGTTPPLFDAYKTSGYARWHGRANTVNFSLVGGCPTVTLGSGDVLRCHLNHVVN